MWWWSSGWRRGGWSGPWPGRGPFSYLPPWQRPGWMFGFGRGLSWGWNPWTCARFPWLPRWWWAYPSAYGPFSYGYPSVSPAYWQAPQQPSQTAQQPTTPYPFPPFLPPPPTPEQEIQTLEAYKAELEEELKSVEARIKELKELATKGGEAGK